MPQAGGGDTPFLFMATVTHFCPRLANGKTNATKQKSHEFQGVVHHGVIAPDDPAALPEGTRVSIRVAQTGTAKPFGEHYAQFKGAEPGLPTDLAEQYDRYRLGTPKR